MSDIPSHDPLRFGRGRAKGAVRMVKHLIKEGSTPVNKGDASTTSRLPQIDHPVLLAGVGAATVGVGAVLASLKSSRRNGRVHRMEMAITEALQRVAPTFGASIELANLQVHEGFGKPSLVVIDVAVLQGQSSKENPFFAESSEEEPIEEFTEAQLRTILDAVMKAVWDNPELAPVSIRAQVLDASDGQPLVDCTSLGCKGDTAIPTELYERFGAPASDPLWGP